MVEIFSSKEIKTGAGVTITPKKGDIKMLIFIKGKRNVCFALIMALLITFPLIAHDGDGIDVPKLKRIAISHDHGEVVRMQGKPDNPDISECRELADKLDFTLKRKEVVHVYLIDYNPFLYKYQWKGITKTKTEDLAPIQKFLEAITPMEVLEGVETQDKVKETISKLTGEKTMIGGLSPETSISEKSHEKFLKNLKAVRAYSQGMLKDIKTFNHQWNVLLLKERLGKWDLNYRVEIQNFFKKVESEQLAFIEKFPKLEFVKVPSHNALKKKAMKRLADCVEKVGKKDEEQKDNKEVQETARKQFIDTYNEVLNEKLIRLSNDLAEKNRILQNALYYYTYLAFIQDQKKAVLELLDKIESINTIMKEMSQEKGVFLGKVRYSHDEIITAHISIEKIAKNDIKNKFAGEVKLVFRPYRKFQFTFGVAQVWSTFKKEDPETGKKKDTQLQAPILTITPTKWKNNAFRLALQLGLTVEDNIYHALVGPAVFLKDWLLFGGGVHFRIGGEFDEHFGAYFNVSFNFGKTTKK